MIHRSARKPGLALVLPGWHESGPLPLHWAQIVEALSELDVHTEAIFGTIYPLLNREQPPPGRRALLPSTAFLRQLFRCSAPIFLCVEYSVATALCAVLSRVRGRRTIIFQEHSGRQGLELARWEQIYRRLVGASAHAIVANTDDAYAELTEVLRVNPRKIFRATLLVPPERFSLLQLVEHPPAASRRPLFLFVGQLVKRKNVHSLLAAADVLRRRGLEFEVWIVGDGPERAVLEEHAAEIGDGVVRFLGSWKHSAIGAVYEAADVFVMPSLRDYRSVAVLEAMRFGKPILDSARDGNSSDFVHHEVTGLVFDPNQADALAEAMRRAIAEPGLFREMGIRASKLLEEHTPRSAATTLYSILKAVRS